jgi:predicted phage terminase large subunit-like protein
VGKSLFHQLVEKLGPEGAVDALLGSIPGLTIEGFKYAWQLHARPEQLPPDGDWNTWLCLAGRGWGKTRVGAEWVRDLVASGKAKRIAIVAPTLRDARQVMVEGESGLLAVCPPELRAREGYQPGLGQITFANGATVTWFSAEEPERLRGPQFDAAWCDELCAWARPETWDMLQMATRLGEHPRICITTTPKPTPLLKSILKDPRTVISRGSTFDNAKNLAANFLAAVESKYSGTRLGRQELYAEVLEDTQGALWSLAMLDQHRVKEAPELVRVVVGVDPSVTASGSSDETGIVVVGKARDGQLYVLGDHSGRMSVDAWARKVVEVFEHYSADVVVGEVNQGGDLVQRSLKQAATNLPFRAVRATRGKLKRAEPVAMVYEQGRAHHVGCFNALEDQLVSYTPTSKTSPDRLDALVWACSELLGTTPASFGDLEWTAPARTF